MSSLELGFLLLLSDKHFDIEFALWNRALSTSALLMLLHFGLLHGFEVELAELFKTFLALLWGFLH